MGMYVKLLLSDSLQDIIWWFFAIRAARLKLLQERYTGLFSEEVSLRSSTCHVSNALCIGEREWSFFFLLLYIFFYHLTCTTHAHTNIQKLLSMMSRDFIKTGYLHKTPANKLVSTILTVAPSTSMMYVY